MDGPRVSCRDGLLMPPGEIFRWKEERIVLRMEVRTLRLANFSPLHEVFDRPPLRYFTVV